MGNLVSSSSSSSPLRHGELNSITTTTMRSTTSFKISQRFRRHVGSGGGGNNSNDPLKKKKFRMLKKNKRPGSFPNVSFTCNDSYCVIYGSVLERSHVRQLSKEACNRNADNIRRMSFAACTLGMDSEPHVITSDLLQVCQKHAPKLEWLIISCPFLITNNDQACQILDYFTTNEQRVASLKKLSLSSSPPVSVSVGQAISRLLQHKHSALERLILNRMSWKNTQALQELGVGVANATSLAELELTHCRITNDGFHAFVQSIVQTSTTRRSSSSQHHRKDDSMTTKTTHNELENGHHVGMKVLDLTGNNRLTSEALNDLIILIELWKHQLNRLILNGMTSLFTNATNDQIKKFIHALKDCTALEELYLTNTGMNEIILQELLNQVLVVGKEQESQTCNNNNKTATTTRLQVVDISFNPISRITAQRILIPILPHLPQSLRDISFITVRDDDDDHHHYDDSNSNRRNQQEGQQEPTEMVIAQQQDDPLHQDDSSTVTSPSMTTTSQCSIERTRKEFHQALLQTKHLKELRLLEVKEFTLSSRQRQRRSEIMMTTNVNETNDRKDDKDELHDDNDNDDVIWFQSQVKPIMERNILYERLHQLQHCSIPHGVWSYYLAQSRSEQQQQEQQQVSTTIKSISSSSRSASQVYQTLHQRLLETMSTLSS